MFEFMDVVLGSEGEESEYYWYDLLSPGRWNYRVEDHFKLAVL